MAAWHLSKENELLKVNSSVSIYDVKFFDGLGFCIIQGVRPIHRLAPSANRSRPRRRPRSRLEAFAITWRVALIRIEESRAP